MATGMVHVDLENKSCVVDNGHVQHGAWAPGVTRRTVETVIGTDGWRFAPDSQWVTTPDGGSREVVR